MLREVKVQGRKSRRNLESPHNIQVNFMRGPKTAPEHSANASGRNSANGIFDCYQYSGIFRKTCIMADCCNNSGGLRGLPRLWLEATDSVVQKTCHFDFGREKH
jgi:hypothetical protein